MIDYRRFFSKQSEGTGSDYRSKATFTHSWSLYAWTIAVLSMDHLLDEYQAHAVDKTILEAKINVRFNTWIFTFIMFAIQFEEQNNPFKLQSILYSSDKLCKNHVAGVGIQYS